MPNNTPYEVRLFNKCIPEPNSGCWLWVGATVSEAGYGYMAYKGKNQLAHRISYMLKNGDIPDGLYVCHKCDVKCCVNPDHLFVGTNAENIHDALSKRGSWAIKGEKNTSAKLTADNIRAIRSLHGDGETMASIARKFGVSRTSIMKIIRRDKWRHIH